ncbi:NAD(P)-binding domain-containing protein [Actinoplanes bogorensis]|uniref:NAD(P)-binding domain-containing protein n=1 Tax=Paractinoplanes bogorensis TaxID=1610840 RepID=A0ABS5YF52_9ACTN|nr:NAD(P)-binding domain-containing protein [Actinoplanes bogorensis]MBU2661928.1 NAD(P)-binding domain-containing protein [Actinoplanes bogorensis]
MKIAVIGTGMVGRGLAGRLARLGHDVVVGTRDADATAGRSDFQEWQQAHPDVGLLPFAQAGAFGELVINASAGASSLAALDAVGADNLDGKVLLDLAIPLDLSQGLPPTLLIAADDSLGERIQRAFPGARVVKSLHTMYFEIMIDPARIPGPHSVFVAGEDAAAKKTVSELLGEFGWPQDAIIDLGGITTARGTEMYSRLYFDLVGAFGDFNFTINVVRAA